MERSIAVARKLSDPLVERDVSLFGRRADGHHANVIEVCFDGRIAQGGDRI